MVQQQAVIANYQQQPKQAEEVTSGEQVLRLLLGIIVIGLLGILLYAIQPSIFAQWYSIFGVGSTLAGAFLLIGGLLGFLFGVPRQQQTIERGYAKM
jgi:uncharacterized BrkB/YihY/UPF0761 family membrane protein